MFTYLQTREHYEDIYDKWTVESCRRMASYEPEATDEDLSKVNLTPKQVEAMKEIKQGWPGVARELAVFSYAAERYNQKAETIEGWERKDREHDERLTKIKPPVHIRCRECFSTSLRLISQDERPDGKNRERVLFMYKCSACSINTAYYDNGEQYRSKPTLCPKCHHDKPASTTKESKHKYTVSYICSSCGHKWQEVMDFTPLPEPPDPNYNEDRKLYCYSDKVREWAISAERIGPLLKEFSVHDEHQKRVNEYKEALAKIKKLTIPQVIQTLKPAIEKQGYIEVKFAEPEIGRNVIVSFNCMDSDPNREAYDSQNTLKRLVNRSLKETNWRLMSDGTHYRLGYLTGRIKAYESEGDVLSLVKKLKKTD